MILDFTILEKICNLVCEYCRGSFGFSKADKRLDDWVCFGEASWEEYLKNPFIGEFVVSRESQNEYRLPVDLLVQATVATLDFIEERLPVNSIKLSGGELTLFPEIIVAAIQRSSKATLIKVLSNGLLLTSSAVEQWLTCGKDLVIQVSLDGVDGRANAHRFKSAHVISRVLHEVKQISALGVPIEINTVLTRASIDEYHCLVDWAAESLGNATLFPRPVRNISDKRLIPVRSQALTLAKNLERNWAKYERLFPSRQYCDLLLHIIGDAKIQRVCRVPMNVAAVSLSGRINACTIGGTPSVGNIFESPGLLRRCEAPNREVASNCWSVCRLCLSEYEAFNSWGLSGGREAF